MSLEAGTRLGAYEVLSAIGAGGMGEVYRARDTRLKRDVAIKVLPDSFATDPDRLARFHREAELLASLNHPNIASIYGLEDGPAEAGPHVRAIVLELIEGDTLADLIARGPLMLSALLPIARQVCEALEAAHEKGVIHRDLKPANIKVTPDGKVKVLDFGLAAVAQDSSGRQINATHSPTLTLATQAGLILGTAAYMAPEQATGAIADKRADVWAFGVVLWEMLTGKSLFAGDTVSHTLAYVITREPDWTALPANTPPSIRRLLRRCLEKDRKRRLPEIASARMEIDEALMVPVGETTATAAITPANAMPRWQRTLPWALAAFMAIALGTTLAFWKPWQKTDAAVIRLTGDIGVDASLAASGVPAADVAISPDGKRLAYVAATGSGSPQLYVRRLDQLQATLLSSTDDAANPFFSPNGEWIAFFSAGKLKKVSVNGGGPVTLCDAPSGRGGTWADDGGIIFTGSSTPGAGLLRVPDTGGTPEKLTAPQESENQHRWPQALKGGAAVLFTAGTPGTYEDGNIMVQTIRDGSRKIVQRGGYFGRYLASGHLIYVHGGTLYAEPFDVDRLEVTGPSVPVLERVAGSTGTGAAQLAGSANGTLVYLAGDFDTNEASISSLDRAGKTTVLRSMPAGWSNPAFSPDGSRLAIDISTASSVDVWLLDWTRGTMPRLTSPAGVHFKPVWSPDGRRIVYSANSGTSKGVNLYSQRADGTGAVQRLTESDNNQLAASWHPGGRFIAFQEQNPKTSFDVMILPIEGDESSGFRPGKPTPFLNTPAAEQEAMFSPDGRWVAYQSTDSGRTQIYVQPFPGPGGRQQISIDGGLYPMWSRSEHELFYATFDNQIMVSSYTMSGDSFVAEKPHAASPLRFSARPRVRPINIHPDGERFVVAVGANSQPSRNRDRLVFIFNFFEELKRIAPVK